MTVLRCTAKLFKRLRQPAKPPEPVAQDNPLGEWYADLEFWHRQPLALLLNARTGAQIRFSLRALHGLVRRHPAGRLAPGLSALPSVVSQHHLSGEITAHFRPMFRRRRTALAEDRRGTYNPASDQPRGRPMQQHPQRGRHSSMAKTPRISFKRLIGTLCLFFLVGLLALPVAAENLEVQNCLDYDNPDDIIEGSLRHTIANADSGDTILLGHLECFPIYLEAPIFIPVDNLKIFGSGSLDMAGQPMAVIDGQETSSIFRHPSANATLELRGLYLRNGRSTGIFSGSQHLPSQPATGGCIYSRGNVAVLGSLLSNCQAVDEETDLTSTGGAIYVEKFLHLEESTIRYSKAYSRDSAAVGGAVFAGILRAERSRIHDNEVSSGSAPNMHPLGGGIYVEGAFLLQELRLEGNRAITGEGNMADPRGGGLYAAYSPDPLSRYILQSTIHDNHAIGTVGGTSHAGGLYLSSHGTDPTVIHESRITGNSASWTSGGIEAGGLLLVASSTIADNHAWEYGGLNFSGAEVEIRHSTISGNTSQFGSAGVRLDGPAGAEARIFQNTISGNQSENSSVGAGLSIGANVQAGVWNSTIVDNVARNLTGTKHGAGISMAGGDGIGLVSTIVYGNQTFGDSGACVSGCADDIGLVAGSGIDELLGAKNLVGSWAAGLDLPGDTVTTDPLLGPLQNNGGLTKTHLPQEGSPAIDAGRDGFTPLDWDQRGHGYARLVGDDFDIGAVEVGATPMLFSDGFEEQD